MYTGTTDWRKVHGLINLPNTTLVPYQQTKSTFNPLILDSENVNPALVAY
jgi:hypothetical protein